MKLYLSTNILVHLKSINDYLSPKFSPPLILTNEYALPSHSPILLTEKETQRNRNQSYSASKSITESSKEGLGLFSRPRAREGVLHKKLK